LSFLFFLLLLLPFVSFFDLWEIARNFCYEINRKKKKKKKEKKEKLLPF